MDASFHHILTLAFGILGNFISFMVYLSPVPTFVRIYKKKSTEGFQSSPYLVALFSAMLWIYYAFLKRNDYLLITINTIGCVIETTYIAMYIAYSPRKAKMFTARLFFLFNLGLFCLIIILTQCLARDQHRVQIMGWICMVFSVSVFVAPLSIMRVVIHTKSVEFMPFWLSFFLTLSAVMWFSYGMMKKDRFIAIPNILGFVFGILQMLLYAIYKNAKKAVEEKKLPEHVSDIVISSTIGRAEVHPIERQKVCDAMNVVEDQTPPKETPAVDLRSENEAQLRECEV